MPKNAALIIGASASIGSAVTAAFAGQFGSVIATHRSNPITGTANNVVAQQLTLEDADSRAALIAEITKRGVKLDAVVILAGIINGKSLTAYDDAMAHKIMDVNFTSQALLIQQLLPHFAKGGRLIIVSSIAAERGSFDPFYAASKGAMIPFVKSLATQYGEQFSTVAVLPGPIEDSTMFVEMDAETQARHLGQSPRGAILNPTELAAMLADMAAPHWAHANGAIIRLNGGCYV